MVHEVLGFAAEYTAAGKKVTLITLTEKSKGAPGAEGQIMAVSADGSAKGTIGGGLVEHMVIERAKKAMSDNEKVFHFEFDLGETGMICGGTIKGFGNVLGHGNTLIIFGGGHIAQKLAPLGESIGFHVTVIDDREDLAVYFKNCTYISCSVNELDSKLVFDESSYLVVCTRGHQQDYDALKFCVEKKYAYLGMIGSKGKVKSTFEKLITEGVKQEYLDKIYAPIGLKISDGTPEEIAVAIIAEILLVKNNATLACMSGK